MTQLQINHARPTVWALNPIIQDVCQYILENNGPDLKGNCHPTKSVDHSLIATAISLAESRGLAKGWRPYHFNNQRGFYTDLIRADEVMCKLVDQVLVQNYKGDYYKLFTEANRSDLITNCLIDQVNGRKIKVVTNGALCPLYANSCFKMLARYRELRGIIGYENLRPYHMKKAPQGTYSNRELINELLNKAVALLLPKFGSDYFRLFTEAVKADFLSEAVIDVIDGRAHKTTLGTLVKTFSGNTFKLLEYFRQINNVTGFEKLRPYHHKFGATQGTYSDSYLVDEVLCKKVDQVLRDFCNGDLHKLFTAPPSDQLLQPFTEIVNGREVAVSVSVIWKHHYSNSFELLKRYREIKGIVGFERLRPYHRIGRISDGTLLNDEYVDEMLLRKVEQLKTNFPEQSEVKFWINVSGEDLFNKPLIEKVSSNNQIEISMQAWAGKFSSSPWKVLQRYKQLRPSLELEQIRPYHLKTTPSGTWEDADIVDEVLVKQVETVMRRMSIKDPVRFWTSVKREELFSSSLLDQVAGVGLEVVLSSWNNCFRSCVWNALERYRELDSSPALNKLQPYHLSYMASGFAQDKVVVDRLIVTRISQILNEKNGDLIRLYSELNISDLLSSFYDEIDGHKINVSFNAAYAMCGGSCYEILKRFTKLQGISFPYTKMCLSGEPECRLRRMQGRFSYRDKALIRELGDDKELNTKVFGLSSYNTKDKQAARDVLVEASLQVLGDLPIKYLGLESPNLISLRMIYRNMNLFPEASLVVERDPRVYSAMISLRQTPDRKINEGRAMKRVRIQNSSLLEAVNQSQDKFNLINLDFLGFMSPEKEEVISNLFKRNLIEDKAVLFVTLEDSPLARSRAVHLGYDNEQVSSVRKIVANYLGDNYTYTPLFAFDYQGGSSSNRKHAMLFLGFELSKKSLI